ncbi:MAG: hypothetical protein BWX88_03276 [Planctomycetes bacterium ADurb.Bin126]|nr:MAG: hypothetical protein BWX88_03276 [Planctomycetes bacterium ADurb.Bin126]HOD81630.1 hypothetical protein [Phycisphaerae bacterium]HQL71952.1 hypothetical protein [Phycisphaerae bacterium]
MKRGSFLPAVCVAAVLALPAGLLAQVDSEEALRVDGPFTHQNLSIYILFRKRLPGNPPDYLTLKEGLRTGQVAVSEASRARVEQLLVTNKSDKRLFLQVGELLHGGRQDRTLQTSLVIAPHSADVPIPSFCIEKSRWSGGKELSAVGAIAPQSVQRSIASGSQARVWDSVRSYKESARAAAGIGGASSGSSLNEELRSREFQKVIGGYEAALGHLIRRYRNPIGMVWAINGQIEQAEVYHSSDLFAGLFPQLLASAAAEAGSRAGRGIPVPLPMPRPGPREPHVERDVIRLPRPVPPPTHNPPALKQVSDFLVAVWDGSSSREELGHGNVRVRVTNSAGTKDDLLYQGEWIHAHILPRQSGVIVPLPRPPVRPMPHPVPYPREDSSPR